MGEAFEEQEFEVEGIEGKRTVDGALEYLVAWKGFEERTWEPLENLEGCKVYIDKFEKLASKTLSNSPEESEKEDQSSISISEKPAEEERKRKRTKQVIAIDLDEPEKKDVMVESVGVRPPNESKPKLPQTVQIKHVPDPPKLNISNEIIEILGIHKQSSSVVFACGTKMLAEAKEVLLKSPFYNKFLCSAKTLSILEKKFGQDIGKWIQSVDFSTLDKEKLPVAKLTDRFFLSFADFQELEFHKTYGVIDKNSWLGIYHTLVGYPLKFVNPASYTFISEEIDLEDVPAAIRKPFSKYCDNSYHTTVDILGGFPLTDASNISLFSTTKHSNFGFCCIHSEDAENISAAVSGMLVLAKRIEVIQKILENATNVLYKDLASLEELCKSESSYVPIIGLSGPVAQVWILYAIPSSQTPTYKFELAKLSEYNLYEGKQRLEFGKFISNLFVLAEKLKEKMTKLIIRCKTPKPKPTKPKKQKTGSEWEAWNG